jgi:hypothetical protein
MSFTMREPTATFCTFICDMTSGRRPAQGHTTKSLKLVSFLPFRIREFISLSFVSDHGGRICILGRVIRFLCFSSPQRPLVFVVFSFLLLSFMVWKGKIGKTAGFSFLGRQGSFSSFSFFRFSKNCFRGQRLMYMRWLLLLGGKTMGKSETKSVRLIWGLRETSFLFLVCVFVYLCEFLFVGRHRYPVIRSDNTNEIG